MDTVSRKQQILNLIVCRGHVTLESALEPCLLERLKNDIDTAYEQCQVAMRRNLADAELNGAVHHVLGAADSFLDFLQEGPGFELVTALLGGKFILNSFGGVINTMDSSTYVHNIHRDVRSFTLEYRQMVNMLVMLDDFTIENGATYVLSGSHHLPSAPSEETFFSQADRLLGKSGDIVIFDSRLWHAAGLNRTPVQRRALTLTFTPPYYKQQLDYCRLLGADAVAMMSEELRQILSFNARTPASLDEWYQPADKRFYQKTQG